MASLKELVEAVQSQQGDVDKLRKRLESANVPVLKELCRHFKIVHSNKRKTELVETLVGLAETSSAASAPPHVAPEASAKTVEITAELEALPTYDSVSCWVHDFLIDNFIYGDIYTYLVEVRDKSSSDRQRSNFKSLKGYSYFTSGWVSNVWMCCPDPVKPQYIYARGHVHQSYPSREKSAYPVFITMSPQGAVYSARCKCAAGLGESCSHVAALLFYLLDCKEKDATTIQADATCTGRLMSWHRPPPQLSVPAVPLADAVFEATAYGKESRKVCGGSLSTFEPRAAQDLAVDDHCVQELLDTFASKLPTSGLFQFWNHPSLAKKHAMHTLDKQAKQLVISRHPRTDQFSDDLDEDVVVAMCTDLANDSSIDSSLASYIESVTKKQSRSPLWRDIRVGRITSSIFHVIVNRRETTSPDSLVKTIMGYSNMPKTTAMQWGIMHEAKAVEDYLRLVNFGFESDIAVRHTPSGVTLYQEYSFIGASSDGLLYDPASSDPHGLIEVKCPFSIDGVSINKMSPAAICNQFGHKFCLTRSDGGKLLLRRTHKFYTQVQGELAVMDKEWADFVMWTDAPYPTNLHIERIFRDSVLWNDTLLPKLKAFYISHVLPEIHSRKLFAEHQKSTAAAMLSPVSLPAAMPSLAMPIAVPSPAAVSSPAAVPTPAAVPSLAAVSSPSAPLPVAGRSPALSQKLAPRIACCSQTCAFPGLKPKACRNSHCAHYFHHICTTDDMGNYCMHCFVDTDDL
eukprot:scpid35546/ scgid0780/ 